MRFLSMGDRALTVEFASGFDAAARAAVVALDQAIMHARDTEALAGVLDVAPTFRSLTVHYDPFLITRAALENAIRGLATDRAEDGSKQQTLWRLPVCYGGPHGPDLQELAADTGLGEPALIDLHVETEVSVHMLGFLPGFAFMGDIAEDLRKPRRREPRLRVPAGSVAVADRLTAIYPWESPGGWHLIGGCPVPLFDVESSQPTLLAPGDKVRFDPVSETEFAQLRQGLTDGALSVQMFRQAS